MSMVAQSLRTVNGTTRCENNTIGLHQCPFSVKSCKFMLRIMFSGHIAAGTEVVVEAVSTLPSHSAQYILSTTRVTYHSRMYRSYVETEYGR